MIKRKRESQKLWLKACASLLVGSVSLVFVMSATAQDQAVSNLVKYRQNFMDTKNQLNYGITLLTRTIKLDDKPKTEQILTYAVALSGMANNILDLFPYGSTDAKSRVLPGIWDAQGGLSEEFINAAAAMRDRANELAAAAKTGNLNEVKRKSRALNLNCKECHNRFRKSYPAGHNQ